MSDIIKGLFKKQTALTERDLEIIATLKEILKKYEPKVEFSQYDIIVKVKRE